MKQNRDCSIIKHMLQYCDRINEAVGFFGKEYEVFKKNNIYKDAVALSILQIGELSGVLTDEFKEKYPDIRLDSKGRIALNMEFLNAAYKSVNDLLKAYDAEMISKHYISQTELVG